ncbi:MAG: TonB-dependent receptor [Saprospiraceae bacterium]|nr:TonB-dependent receptor [Saprospiraceae bacterium]
MKRRLLILPLLLVAVLAIGQKEVSGTITSAEDGIPVIGASILVKGTSVGTVTDVDGKYTLSVPGDDAVLVISYTGLKTIEITVGNRTRIDLVMESSVAFLDEVVVTGYGTQGRRVLTSAVSSVKAEDIQNLPSASIDQLVQGRAAGVQISSNSGTPGGGMFVRVRGTTSITASSDPLYVIDGIPVVSTPLESQGTGGQRTNPLADLNPADIESVEVLKDASATAIYGARAANGVVLITTKRGKKSQNARVTLNAYAGAQNFARDPSDQLVNAAEFETLINEARANAGAAPLYPDANSGKYDTDWNSFIYDDAAPIYNADLSISGGSDKVRYFVSGNYFDQDGVLIGTKFTRYTGRLNLDFDASDKIKLGTSILYSRNDRTRIGNDDNISGAMGGAYFLPPNISPYTADGSFTKFSIFENPIAVVNFDDRQMAVNRILANIYGEWEILPYLKFKTSGSVDYNEIKEDNYAPTQLNTGVAVAGSAVSAVTLDDNLIWENILTFQKGLGGEHYLTVLLGQSLQTSRNEFTRASGQGFPSNDFRRITSAAIQTSSSTGTEWGISSLFGRLNYDFAGKYIVTVNVRRDGSSRFGEKNRWGTFPSIGAAWRLSQEPFFPQGSFINELKLRGSYGITGNQSGIDNFASLGLWTGGANYTSSAGTRPLQLANPNLKWEETTQLDFGFDLGLLNERIVLNFDWYNKYTRDLLLDVPLPRTTGFISQTQNFGEIENEGWELTINATPFRKADFTWDISFNVAHNKAIVRKLFAPIEIYNRSPFRLEEGQPVFSFWFHDQIEVDAQTGDIIWRTVNGTSRTEAFVAGRDRFFVGNAQPDLFGGINNSITFKGFDFSMFWQYSLGNEQLNWTRFFLEHGGTRNTNFMRSQLDRWQKPGDITEVPRMASKNYAADLRPSRLVEDGSYIRLKNLTVGYSLPASLTRKMGMQKLRVYLSGQNLITITDYSGLDPELTGTAATVLTQGIEFFTFPQARVMTGGLTLIF